jgi:hypothetical protein
MTFEQVLVLLKGGKKITNSRGNIYYLENDHVYCTPKAQYPNGKREEVKLYWDAILKDDWVEFNK